METKKITVYCLLDPRSEDFSPRYVGQTSERLKSRTTRHRNKALNFQENGRKDEWIRELHQVGLEPLQHPLEICDNQERADQMEQHYIKLFSAAGNLLNEMTGGKSGGNHSQETKKKIAQFNIGKEVAESTKRKIRDFQTGRSASADTKKKMSEAKKIPVVQLSLAGEHIADHCSSRDAARVVQVHYSGIQKCCKGQVKTAAGFKWKYAA